VSGGAPSGAATRATGDVPLLLAVALGIPLYAMTMLAAHYGPAYIKVLLLERGWVQHAIILLTSLAIAILALKALAMRVQRRAFAVDLLPEGVERVTPADVPAAIEHLDQQRRAWRDTQRVPSFVLERARRVLDHFGARGDADETSTFAAADADGDANAVSSSLGTVKVLIWAIPILGFIGTVIGISDAVAGFSRSLADAERLDAIKGSLGDVTTGLAVAFDTTLLALVASIVVMLPTSWMQRREEQLMAEVDDHCGVEVVRRLVVAAPSPAPVLAEAAPAPQRALELVVSEELRRALAEGLVAPLRETMIDVAAAHAKVVARLAEEREATIQQHGELLQQHASLADHLAAFSVAARGLGPSVERAVYQLTAATGVAERSAEAAGRTQDQLARELGASRQLLQLLAAGLGTMPHRPNDASTAPVPVPVPVPVPAPTHGNDSNGHTHLAPEV
jgi:biopolymer transport protein ExbB/TolQ